MELECSTTSLKERRFDSTWFFCHRKLFKRRVVIFTVCGRITDLLLHSLAESILVNT